jgi:hypothetical protein
MEGDPQRVGIVWIPRTGSLEQPVIEPAPLHEHFGETRTMRRHRLATETPLPWFGGWWLALGASPEAVVGWEPLGEACRIALASPQLVLKWRPDSTDVQEAVSLCSDSDGSAN